MLCSVIILRFKNFMSSRELSIKDLCVSNLVACKAGGFSDRSASKTAITNDQSQNGGWSFVIAVLEAFPTLKPPALQATNLGVLFSGVQGF